MIYLTIQRKWGSFHKELRLHSLPILLQSICDNAAWLFYASAMTIIPISIATTISESYIILTSLLGIVVNHERLNPHQWLGIVIAIISILLLSVTTS